jgi:fatty-acyl-CoA synthase
MPQGAEERCTLDVYEKECAGRHTLHGVVDWWAARAPAAPALIHHNAGRAVDWRELQQASESVARKLAGRGFRKGDFLVTSLPFTLDHVFLAYACFRLGVIHVPLDLRMPPADVARCLQMLGAREYAGMAEPPAPVEETVSAAALASWEERPYEAHPDENDAAQIIFTTGSTGSPKAAMLSHRNITSQNLSLGTAFRFGPGKRTLVNLPPSHVGGQAELLMTTLFCGGTAVLLDVFDPAKSLAAIEEHQVILIGQIPAMFQFEWRQADYAQRDFSSVEAVVYGGQQVNRPFLEKMAAMGRTMGTGLGLTESAGFCTYTPLVSDVEALMEAGLGFSMPLYPMSVRAPMRGDGLAGDEASSGEVGHICFKGPQTFLGYLGNPEATAQTISRDGYLYTGDLGAKTPTGCRMVGRAKWVIKPAGYQVFPGDVEAHFLQLEQVGACGVVGAEHRTLSEAVVAFIEPKPGAEVSVDELRRHGRSLASYMRPLHYVIVPPGQLPLNRTAKIDTLRLQQMAREAIAALRERGRWDN